MSSTGSKSDPLNCVCNFVALRRHTGHDMASWCVPFGPTLSLGVGYRKARYNAEYASPVTDSVHFA
jgi:hypothetical protein